jgi:putative transposase
MSHARPIHAGTTYLITRRTERRHRLLRPDSRMTGFIFYSFIVSAYRHGIMLHAFCAMSTHLHYVVTDPLGTLPRFLEMFHRLVAQGTKIIRKWDGAVWNRSQTSVVELCTRQAIVEKIAYTLANPVQAGLVWNAHEWPGAKTSVNDIGINKIGAQRPDDYFHSANPEWILNGELQVSLPPLVPETEADEFRNDVERILASMVRATHSDNPNRRVLGPMRAMMIQPESRVTSHEYTRQVNPTFAIGRGNAKSVRTAEIDKLRAFRTAYREALMKWRAGDRSVEFPAGTYAMRVFHGANVAQIN